MQNLRALGATDLDFLPNHLKLPMNVAGVILMLNLSKFGENSFSSSFKNAKSLVMISQLAENLAKISVSLLSISRGVLVQMQHFSWETTKWSDQAFTVYGTI